MSSEILQQPVSSLKGVGAKVAEKLAKLNIRTLQDVLFHLPLRYQDRTRVFPIGSLREGMECVIEANVDHSEVKFGRRRMLLVHVSDSSGSLILRFFHFNARQQKSFRVGQRIRCFATVRKGHSLPEMIHPEYKMLAKNDLLEVEESLTPFYPVTEGLQQQSLRKISDQVLQYISNDVENKDIELLPQALLSELDFPELGDALRAIHRPSPETSMTALLDGKHPAQKRLAFEELLAQQLSLMQGRKSKQQRPGYHLQSDGRLRQKFLQQLPFEMTAAQQKVCMQIEKDLESSTPMMRLVQGDVGSGKTVVAAMALLHAIESGYQAAIMAPTEILAEQHYQLFTQWMQPLKVQCAWLSGKQTEKEKKQSLERIKSGEVRLIAGTHALFQKDVDFENLALLVIDEQHRFGVHQRLALREKGQLQKKRPHQLIMTATPIPRTLAMTAYADLDLSVIDELPPGRIPPETVAMPNDRRPEVIKRIASICEDGQQCYWVCTLVEESEVLQCETAEDTYALLSDQLSGLIIGLIHGRMKSKQKTEIMSRFKSGEINVLVATTVIEVGVDVPNASFMIIENAERLGLSQLHQLRGRVGRGGEKSYCLLLFQAPLGDNGKRRIKAMRDTSDGFKIAEIDLKIRGPGELLGTRQTGLARYRIADIMRDAAMLPRIKSTAIQIMQQYPYIIEPLIDRWIGENNQYQQV